MMRGFSQPFSFAFLVYLLVGLAHSSAHSQISDRALTKTVYVSVTTADGDFVTELKDKDFELKSKDNGLKLQTIALTKEPMAIGFLVDVSGSMERPGKKSVNFSDGIKRFISISDEGNEYSLLKFARNVDVSVRNNRGGTQILEKLAETDTVPTGSTLLFDALLTGYEVVASSTLKKKALIVFSDGIDSGSDLNFDEFSKWLESKDIQIYFVGIVSRESYANAASYQGEANMDQIAALTGGKSYILNSPEGLSVVLPYIAENFLSQFAAEITPVSATTKSKWMKFTLDVNKRTTSGKGKLTVRTRTGVKL